MDEIHDMWQKETGSMFLGSPPDDLAVFEHASAKVEEARCLGEGKLIELLDRNCLPMSVPAGYIFDCVSRQDAFWQHARALFFVDATQPVGVIEMRFGSRFGRGFSCKLIQKGDRPEFIKERCWVS